jgi:hypothetical protein
MTNLFLVPSFFMQMAEHPELVTLRTINTIAKLVIQPTPCGWNGCTTTVNCWLTLQKVREQLSTCYAFQSGMSCQHCFVFLSESESLLVTLAHISELHHIFRYVGVNSC